MSNCPHAIEAADESGRSIRLTVAEADCPMCMRAQLDALRQETTGAYERGWKAGFGDGFEAGRKEAAGQGDDD